MLCIDNQPRVVTPTIRAFYQRAFCYLYYKTRFCALINGSSRSQWMHVLHNMTDRQSRLVQQISCRTAVVHCAISAKPHLVRFVVDLFYKFRYNKLCNRSTTNRTGGVWSYVMRLENRRRVFDVGLSEVASSRPLSASFFAVDQSAVWLFGWRTVHLLTAAADQCSETYKGQPV